MVSRLHPRSLILPMPSRVLAALTVGPAAWSTAYGLVLLGAALIHPARRPSPGPGRKFTIVIPAHDEQDTVQIALDSVADLVPPPAHVLVVADNCSDDTATVARARGADVLERTDPDERGKGQALAWAFARLPADTEAVFVLDADCAVGSDALAVADAYMAAGARVVQLDYRVANATEGQLAALRAAAFLLHNTVRGRGRAALGLSAGLSGTGMAFDAQWLRRNPWRAFRGAEDRQQHLALVAAGARVHFAGEAAVTSAMPTRPDVARRQQLRWEADRTALARISVQLAVDGVGRRDPVRLETGLEAFVLPQAAVAVAGLAGLALASLSDGRAARALAAFAVLGQGIYVVGGLAITDPPPGTWRALAAAPRLVVGRLGGLLDAARGRGGDEWHRTERG